MDRRDFDLEERLRQYAKAFRREANPKPNLAESLMSGLGDTPRHRGGVFGMVPGVAMAALVLVAGLGIAFGVAQLRNLGRGTTTPSASASVPVPSLSPVPSASATPAPTASATPTSAPTATAQPGVVPGLAAIQMVGSRFGWAVGSHGIYATTDGQHWTKQYASSEQFIGVDFISTTMGWAVGVNSLLGTNDAGRSWHQLADTQQPLRSVHFSSALEGWGIAGGDEPLGSTIPSSGATLVTTNDGGASWRSIESPANPQSVCFADGTHGWLATAGFVYRSNDGGKTWVQSLQMASTGTGLPGSARIECAGAYGLWVDWAPGGAAAGHSPYVVYATVDAQHWRTVMAEPYTIGNQLPGVPAGPGSYPGSFSVVDPSDAVFVGDTPPMIGQATMIATHGGATLKSTGAVPESFGTFGSAFISTSTGWVLAENVNQQVVIEATTDGGYHWSAQLALPR